MLSPTATLRAPAPGCAHTLSIYAICAWPLALIGQFLFVFAVVSLSSPGRIDIVDGQTRYEVARSLVDHGDSIIRDRASWFAVYKGRDGQDYTDYRLPQSLLGVGAILLADATGPVSEARRQFFFSLISPCMAALLAVIYALWFRNLGYSPLACLGWGAAGIFCTPAWFYGTSTFDDILGTTAIVGAVAAVWLTRERWPVLGAALAGIALAWAVNCKPPLALFALPAFAALWTPTSTQRKQVTQYLRAALICFGVFLGVGIYKAYDAYKFPPGSDDIEAEFLQRNGDKWTPNPVPGLVSLSFSPACGALWYCPTIFLSWRGWRAWRERQRVFCMAILAACFAFTIFISFLTFFKGDPGWGPRYLTPVFALCWIFVPAGFSKVQLGWARTILMLGVVVQLLALSVDPQRLFVRTPLHWNYYVVHPWLGFNGAFAHLVQRPMEIAEVLNASDEPAAEFSPAPIPTHAGGLSSGAPVIASLVGTAATPLGPAHLNVASSIRPTITGQLPLTMKNAVTRYHVFRSPRPWVFNQWYLSDEARPVDLSATIALLFTLALSGCALMAAAPRTAGICLPYSRDLPLSDPSLPE